MNTNYLKLFFFAIAILFLVGGACPSNETTQSNKIAQTEIFQSYFVKENAGKYEVTAFFRIGGDTGTTLALVSPSKILFNGQPLVEHLNTSSGTFYTIEVANTTQNGTFQFTDRQGKTYTNKIDFFKISPLAKNLTATGSTQISVPLSRAIADSTNLTLKLSNASNTETSFVGSVFDSELAPNKVSVIVKPEAFTKFSRGNISLAFDVTDSISTQQGTNLGGNMSFSYQTTPVNIAFSKTGKIAAQNTKVANSFDKNTNNGATKKTLKTANSNTESRFSKINNLKIK